MSYTWLQRLLIVVAGLAWFVWIGYEDRTLDAIVVLSVLLSIPLYLGLWRRLVSGVERTHLRLLASALLGSFQGALVPLIGVLLMFLKTSLHNHVQADFTIEDVERMLQLVLPWSLAGTLAGSSAGLLRMESKGAHVAPAPSVEYNDFTDNEKGDEANDG